MTDVPRVSEASSGPTSLWMAVEFFTEVFGGLGRVESIASKENMAVGVVFETFEVHFGFEPGRGIFMIHVRTSPVLAMAPRDVWLAAGNSAQEVREKFVSIERWCRLRLPDDFVAELEQAVGAAASKGGA